jgi:methylthioribulose-1-phosphate dehydratase
MPLDTTDAAANLIRIGQRFDARGWVLGTSGNFSIVVDEEPVRLAITRSGTQKGDLTASDILEVGAEGTSIGATIGVPSAETRLHLEIVAARPAAAVMHTHSIWSTLLSDRLAPRGGVEIKGYEMLKGLTGVSTHEHREWIPILDNDQDMARLAVKVAATLREHPACHGFLLRRHGLYTWGATVPEAVRHVEIIEFLLETIGRKEAASWRS